MPSSKQRPAAPDAAGSSVRPVAARRKLLKSALIGGGAAGAIYMAPERWSRPVIQAVSLPAHAQTSLVLGSGPWAGGSGAMDTRSPGGTTNRFTVAQRIANFLVAPAKAGEVPIPPSSCSFLICIGEPDSDNVVEIQIGFPDFPDPADVRNVALSDDLTFDVIFSNGPAQWNVNGEYDGGADEWHGMVTGPCPDFDAKLIDTRSSQGSTGAAIAVTTQGHLQRVGLSEPDLNDTRWTAVRSDRCPIGDR